MAKDRRRGKPRSSQTENRQDARFCATVRISGQSSGGSGRKPQKEALRRQSEPSGLIEPKATTPRPNGSLLIVRSRASQGKSIVQYLGGISGSGLLKCDGEQIARATYDFDGFFNKTASVAASGEIRLHAPALRRQFGRQRVQTLTDDGRLLDLRSSEKSLPAASDAAHVDVTGDLPNPRSWRR